MGDSQDYMPPTAYPMSFNTQATTDFQEVSPYVPHPPQVPLPTMEDGSWCPPSCPPSIYSVRYSNPDASFHQPEGRHFHGRMAPYPYPMPNQPAIPVISLPPFTFESNYHPTNPNYPSALVGPLEAENVQEVRSTHLTPTAPIADLPNGQAPQWVILPLEYYLQIMRDSRSLEVHTNFWDPMNVLPTFNEGGHRNAMAGSNGDYTNAHRGNTATSQITLETRPLERAFILYFDREGKKIWRSEELLELGRRPEEEGLEGPVTFSSPVYRVVTCGGKECLPSARNQTTRNNFLRGQLGWIGGCAHKPSFKFEGKRPSVILSHLVNKELCTLHKTHPDLVRYAEWCLAL